VPVNESMDTADREFAEIQNKLYKERQKLEKAKEKGINFNNYSDLEISICNKEEDIYSTEDIYERNEMNPQQRRFGSPEFTVRNNSMMYELPTNHLEKVKPGVGLTNWENPLQGEKYEENPYHEYEENVTETEEELNIYEDIQNTINVKVSPITGNTQGLDEDWSEYMNSIDSNAFDESSKSVDKETSDKNPKNLNLKNKENFEGKKNSMKANFQNSLGTPQSKPSVNMPNFEKVLETFGDIIDKEPMTARCKIISS